MLSVRRPMNGGGMTYTVFVYEGGNPISQESFFSNIQRAFTYMGKLDLETNVERCVLDDGNQILFDLCRNADGDLVPTKK